MLFNSYVFIFVFLPVTLAVFFALGRYRERRAAIAWLVAASLFFYGWWNPAYLGLIVASIVFNYVTGTVLGDSKRSPKVRRAALVFGISSNLALLVYYKYAGFFLVNLNAALGTGYSLGEIILPLGISFFTFTQIAFLVDAYRGEAREYNFLHYALFVTYFPHLIAGPVLHHKEMMPQFARPYIYRFDALNFAAGVTYFVLGLFKKAVIADGIAKFAGPVFTAASEGRALSTLDAWGGALAYTFQLYFDFSGYSDMAIGLALMMGVWLPLNFDSPYKAFNIIEFWRRWHMTLSRFLRDYLYISLGGNRDGFVRRYANLLVTMLLGGLWHGAGWTFIIWGGLHGLYLIVNHGWRRLRSRSGAIPANPTLPGRVLGTALTFVAVVVGWVYFRAENVDVAHRVLHAMFVPQGGSLSAFYAAAVEDGGVARWLRIFLLRPAPELLLYGQLALLAGIVFVAPNTQQIMGRYYWQPRGADAPAHEFRAAPQAVETVAGAWRPRPAWALVAAVAATWALLGLTQVSEFLYFQF